MRSEDARSKPEPEASGAEAAAESASGEGATPPDVVAHAETDDLASLSSSLVSIRPGEAPEAADEDANLGALTAAGAARIDKSADAETEDTRLDLGSLVAAASRTVERGPGGPDAASDLRAFAAASSGDATLAMTAASLVPPARQRASWVVPMLVGVGVGAVIAGVAFGFAGARTAEPSGASAVAVQAAAQAPPTTATPALPVPAAAEPLAAAPVAAPAPSAAPAADPAVATTAAAEVAADSTLHAAERPLAAARPVAPRRPAASDPSVAAAPADRTSLLKPKDTTTPEAAAPAAAAAPEVAEPKEPEGQANAKSPSRIDELLDEALSPAAQQAALREKQALALAAEELPATPSREEVTKAMTVLLPAIRGCAMGQTGLMTAGIVVRNDGRVASVDVAGAPFSNTASGRCMEGVMRRAQFPRFKQAIFRIKYPFAIQ